MPFSDVLSGFDPRLSEQAVHTTHEVDRLAGLLCDRGSPVVVVVGSSIPGLLVASGLASRGCAVALVSGKAPTPRRLINGCTFRFGALACAADLLGTTPEALAAKAGGPASLFQRMGFARSASPQPVATLKTLYGRADDPISTSTRHGQILHALRSTYPLHAAPTLIAGEVPGGAGLVNDRLPLRLADGESAELQLPRGRYVILNATPDAQLLRPNRTRRRDDMFVATLQMALRRKDGAPFWGEGSAFGCVVEGERFPFQLFYAPFSDPDTPAADAYVFNGGVLHAKEIEAFGGSDPIIEELRRTAVAWSDAFGLSAVDSDETTASAVLPFRRETAVALQQRLGTELPIVDINNAFSSGAPGVALDGMLCQARASHAFVRAFSVGGDPVERARAALPAADKAVLPIRRFNRFNVWLYYRAKREMRGAFMAISTGASVRMVASTFAHLAAPTHAELTHTGTLRQIGPRLWTLRRLLPLGAARFSSRMTVVVLSDGAVLLHSPVTLDPGEVDAIKRLGPVRYIVAPNLVHHRRLSACRAHFPDATVYLAPGLGDKVPAYRDGAKALDDKAPIAPDDLNQIFMHGHGANETLFFHAHSGTLIVTDLAYNIDPATQGFERFWFRLFGAYNTSKLPSYHKKMITDRAALVASWRKVMALDFTTVSVAHGRLITEQPKEHLRRLWGSVGVEI